MSEDQLKAALETLMETEEFDVSYFIAPYREVAVKPNMVSLYLTAFIIEKTDKPSLRGGCVRL